MYKKLRYRRQIHSKMFFLLSIEKVKKALELARLSEEVLVKEIEF